MGNVVTLYGEDATRYIDLMHKYGAFRHESEDPPRWDAAKVERVAKGLTAKQKEALLLLDGLKQGEWTTTRKPTYIGTREWDLKAKRCVFINGHVFAKLERKGLFRRFEATSGKAENGKAVLEYLKAHRG